MERNQEFMPYKNRNNPESDAIVVLPDIGKIRVSELAKYNVTYKIKNRKIGKRERKILYCLFWKEDELAKELRLCEIIKKCEDIKKLVRKELNLQEWEQPELRYKVEEIEGTKKEIIQRLYIYYSISMKSLVRKGLVQKREQKRYLHYTIGTDRITFSMAGDNAHGYGEEKVTLYSLTEEGLDIIGKSIRKIAPQLTWEERLKEAEKAIG